MTEQDPPTHINVPMSDASRERILREDRFWTAPKLIFLCALTLGLSFALLYAMSTNLIGPTIHQ